MTGTNIDVAVGKFTEIYSSLIRKHVPRSVSFFKPSNKPWFNSHLHRLRRIHDRLFAQFRKSSINSVAESVSGRAYKAVRNYYVAELRRAERLYYQDLQQKLSASEFNRSSRQWWKVARSACGLRPTSAVPAMDTDNGFISDKKSIAELFIGFFCNAMHTE